MEFLLGVVIGLAVGFVAGGNVAYYLTRREFERTGNVT